MACYVIKPKGNITFTLDVTRNSLLTSTHGSELCSYFAIFISQTSYEPFILLKDTDKEQTVSGPTVCSSIHIDLQTSDHRCYFYSGLAATFGHRTFKHRRRPCGRRMIWTYSLKYLGEYFVGVNVPWSMHTKQTQIHILVYSGGSMPFRKVDIRLADNNTVS
jgi:hypothetical protein